MAIGKPASDWKLYGGGIAVASVLAWSTMATPAQALVITSAGAADGFSLAEVVSGFANSGRIGPIGITVNSDGNILVDDVANNTNYVFHDTNGQTVSDAVSSVAFSAFPPGFATSAGTVYASGGYSGSNVYKFLQMNNNGTINHVITPNIPIANGLWTNPVNGHIIASGSRGVYDINPTNGTYRIITSTTTDGLTVSPDGTKVYLAGGQIYDIATGTYLGSYGSIAGADGMGIIQSTNALNGDIVVNSNFGDVVLVDPTTLVQTVIANGGSRGDYTQADPNGTLLLTQTDSVWRLSCGSECGVGGSGGGGGSGGSGGGTVPEPISIALLTVGLVGIGIARSRF